MVTPLCLRALHAGLPMGHAALLRYLLEEGLPATEERYGWSRDQLQGLSHQIVARLKERQAPAALVQEVEHSLLEVFSS